MLKKNTVAIVLCRYQSVKEGLSKFHFFATNSNFILMCLQPAMLASLIGCLFTYVYTHHTLTTHYGLFILESLTYIFFRFSFSKDDIIFKKNTWFLLVNITYKFSAVSLRMSVSKQSLTFEVLAKCKSTKARVGKMFLTHSEVDTPVFMPVGTQVCNHNLPWSVQSSFVWIFRAPWKAYYQNNCII